MVGFTLLMVLSRGSVNSTPFGYLLWLTLPFFPLWLLLSLMGARLVLVATIFLTYAAGYLLCVLRKGERIRWRRQAIPGAMIVLCAALVYGAVLQQTGGALWGPRLCLYARLLQH